MSFRVCETFGRTYQEDAYTLRGRKIYNVTSDTVLNDLIEVLDATALPVLGERWDESIYTYLRVVKRTPLEVNRENKFYRVQIDYEDDGTNLDWLIDFSTVRSSWVPTRTLAKYNEAPTTYSSSRYLSPSGDVGDDSLLGYPITNRAGDTFENQPQTDRYFTQITLKKTYGAPALIGDSTIATIDTLLEFKGTMNNADITIAGITAEPWLFLMDDIKITRVLNASGEYTYDVTFVILYNKDFGWATPIANIGYRALKEAGGIKYTTNGKNSDGTGSNKPFLLDTDGTVLETRDDPSSGGTDAPYYIVFPFFESADWSALELPTSIL